MKYKYVGQKSYILGLNGQKFIKGVIFEETNPKNPFEANKDFIRIKENKKIEKVKEVKKKVFTEKKIVKPEKEEEKIW